MYRLLEPPYDDMANKDQTICNILQSPDIDTDELFEDIYESINIVYFPTSFDAFCTMISKKQKMVTKTKFVIDAIYTWITRCLEYNLQKQFDSVTVIFKKFSLPGRLIMLRPYLLNNVNYDLIDRAKELDITDKEFNLKTFHNLHNNIVTSYSRASPYDSGYFGYRQAWHMLVYGICDYQRLLILAKYYEETNDCSWGALVNWLQWKNGVPQQEWKTQYNLYENATGVVFNGRRLDNFTLDDIITLLSQPTSIMKKIS